MPRQSREQHRSRRRRAFIAALTSAAMAERWRPTASSAK